MIDRIIYKIFGWLDDFCNFFYDKFICDKPKKKKKIIMGRTMNYYFTGMLILCFLLLALCVRPM
jgi:hypothetical protein